MWSRNQSFLPFWWNDSQNVSFANFVILIEFELTEDSRLFSAETGTISHGIISTPDGPFLNRSLTEKKYLRVSQSQSRANFCQFKFKDNLKTLMKFIPVNESLITASIDRSFLIFESNTIDNSSKALSIESDPWKAFRVSLFNRTNYQ